jgi:hypothetical protein
MVFTGRRSKDIFCGAAKYLMSSPHLILENVWELGSAEMQSITVIQQLAVSNTNLCINLADIYAGEQRGGGGGGLGRQLGWV